ncbi:unnamed protein product [Heterobilharzia americana]|nr:unnamed protein product [Heterobilharzia americana]
MFNPGRVQLFNLLNGILCVYKSPEMSVEKLSKYVKRSLANAFNSLPSEMLGRRFFPGDFMLYAVDPLSDFMSGVQVYGIGEDGVYNHATKYEQSSWLKTYHLTCMMGRASTDRTANGRTLLRASWRHVQKSKIDNALVGLQAQFNTSTTLQAGLRPNSQNAYLALCSRSVGSDLAL